MTTTDTTTPVTEISGLNITVSGYNALGLGVIQSDYLIDYNTISGTDTSLAALPGDLSTDLAIGYQDPITNITVSNNTFNGNGLFALVVVNGYTDRGSNLGFYTADVNFSNNIFNASNMRSGAALYYEASSGSINDNTFHTNLFGSAETAIFLARSTLDPNAGLITLQGNNFSSWRGTDIGTGDAAYTFAYGGGGMTFTDNITGFRDIQTIQGWLTGDNISLTPNRETALAAVQHGSGEVDVYLSNNDEIVVQGTNLSASTIATMVHATATDQSALTVSDGGAGTATASNMFVLMGSGAQIDLAATSHDTLAFGVTSPLIAGAHEDVYHFANTDLVELSRAEFGNTLNSGNYSYDGKTHTATITDPTDHNQIVFHDVSGSLIPNSVRFF